MKEHSVEFVKSINYLNERTRKRRKKIQGKKSQIKERSAECVKNIDYINERTEHWAGLHCAP